MCAQPTAMKKPYEMVNVFPDFRESTSISLSTFIKIIALVGNSSSLWSSQRNQVYNLCAFFYKKKNSIS